MFRKKRKERKNKTNIHDKNKNINIKKNRKKNTQNDTKNKYNSSLILWFKIFVIGLLLQFFVHTFFTFELGVTGNFWNFVRIWKELFIVLGASIVVFLAIKNWNNKENFPLKSYILLFLLTLFIILWVALLGDASLFSNSINYIISVRYSMIGFFIFILASYLAFFKIKTDDTTKLLIWRRKLMKALLVLGIFWRGLIWLMPNGLKFFWYNWFSHEWEVGNSPPAVYYTDYNKGLTRNQFVFERPITYGFFLVALWPLFFVLAIRKKHFRELLWRWGLYGLNIFSTFSRAAWGAWVIQTILLFLFLYHKSWKKMLLYFVWPALLGIWIVSYFAADQITHRQYSNTGHLNEIKLAIKKIQKNPLLGAGVGSAGPASHQIKKYEPYNTENQYLQIWVEYWFFWFIWWCYLYIFLHYLGIIAWKENQETLNTKIQRKYNYYIIALAIGMIGLSIENLVLHAFVDRMVVYPFMLLFWLVYWIWWKIRRKN